LPVFSMLRNHKYSLYESWYVHNKTDRQR